jgi:hypothetical protein
MSLANVAVDTACIVCPVLLLTYCAFRVGYATAMRDVCDDLRAELDQLKSEEDVMPETSVARIADRILARAPSRKRTIGRR